MYFDNDPDMSLYLYTLPWFRANQALLLLNASGFISRDAINTNLMVFGSVICYIEVPFKVGFTLQLFVIKFFRELQQVHVDRFLWVFHPHRCRCNKYQFNGLWFDPTVAWTHNLSHLRPPRKPLQQRWGWNTQRKRSTCT
jgi:hypothetical protein